MHTPSQLKKYDVEVKIDILTAHILKENVRTQVNLFGWWTALHTQVHLKVRIYGIGSVQVLAIQKCISRKMLEVQFSTRPPFSFHPFRFLAICICTFKTQPQI